MDRRSANLAPGFLEQLHETHFPFNLDEIFVEVKACASFPAWLEYALKQAESSAVDDTITVAVLHMDRVLYSSL
jgi:hypothetical protein